MHMPRGFQTQSLTTSQVSINLDKHASSAVNGDEQMVTAHCSKSLKEAKLPRNLGYGLGSFQGWNVDWHKVHLGELLEEDLSLTDVLFGKRPCHDAFRALVGLQSQGGTEEIVQYVTQNVTPEASQRAESVRKYLDSLTQRASEQGHGFFTYSTETGLWGIAVQWTGGREAYTHGSIQKAALSALRSGKPCHPKVSTHFLALELTAIDTFIWLPVRRCNPFSLVVGTTRTLHNLAYRSVRLSSSFDRGVHSAGPG